MARIIPLWRSDEISVHRFDHPVEHEDQPYEEIAGAFRASFVECGTFDLAVRDKSWRVNAGDVMLSHPGMRFRASFQGKGFNDTCLSLTYLSANDDGFDPTRRWERSGRHVLPQSNRVRYLRWGLRRAVEDSAPMLAEYCATALFIDEHAAPGALFSERKFDWYAERVHFARERLDREFASVFTVSELARSVGMSMFHFARVFTELVGMPPHQYLLRARLRAARAMLREGRSVTETCFACGFSNLSHFSRSFARRYGHTPSRVTA
jgi:AraC family transcriptional regulator